MGTVKATTIQQRFGFADTDLKTPMHDEIMLWLDSKIEELYKPVFTGWDKTALNNAATHSESYAKRNPEWEGFKIPEFKQPFLSSKVWEYPISSGNFIIGFVDLFAKFSIPSLTLFEGTYTYKPSLQSNDDDEFLEVMFEVKTSIPSLGELIRQLRFYQEYKPAGRVKESYKTINRKYIVVCPDDRFKEPLAQQGIGFLKYEL